MSVKIDDILKKISDKIRKSIDQQFDPLINLSSSMIEWIEKYSKDTQEIETKLSKNPENQRSQLTSVMLNSISKQQLMLAKLQHQTILKLKDISFDAIYNPIFAYVELSKYTTPVLADTFAELVKDIENLRKTREVELNIPDEIKKELQEWFKQQEAYKKAINNIGVV